MTKIGTPSLLAALLFLNTALSLAAPENCGIQLHSLNRYAAAPGEEIEMKGRWGPDQGAKSPRLNHGASHPLEVLAWTDSSIRLRVPGGLKAGAYKIGVYCGLESGNPYSTSWEDFEVLAEPGAELSKTPTPRDSGEETRPAAAPPPEPGGLPDGPWRERFEEQWRRNGRDAVRSKPWLSARRIAAVTDKGVPLSVAEAAAQTALEQLREFGAKRFEIYEGPQAPRELADCTAGGVLNENCFAGAVRALRDRDRGLASSILVVVTNSAIGMLPKEAGGGAAYSGPAGTASHSEGWILITESFRLQNPSPRRFSTHNRERTVRHEVLHLLGLPHHDSMENPGFPESRLCTACTHRGAGGHITGPHAECGMVCGSGDDDWFHIESFGRGFGFCQKCSSAARAVILGIEE